MDLYNTPNVITTEQKLLKNIQDLLIEQNELTRKLIDILNENKTRKIDTLPKSIERKGGK